MHYAIDKDGGETVVELLIAAGADVNARVIQNSEKWLTPLMLAARRGQAAIYRSSTDVREVGASDALDGGDVVPGFRCVLGEILA